MKNFLLILTLLFLAGTLSCEKETESGPQIPLSEAVAGNWLVVYKKHKDNNFMFEEPSRGVVTEWDCYYVLSLQLNADNTYFINDSHEQLGKDGHLYPLGGSWALSGHDTITFLCSDSTATSFRASMNREGQLVFENEELIIRHNRK